MPVEVAAGFAAISSIKSLYEIAKQARDSNDPEKLRLAASQMLDLAMAAREQAAEFQERHLAAMEEIAALKKEIEHLQGFEIQAENYVRIQSRGGTFVYIEKAFADNQSAAPKYCAQCFGNKKLAILQPLGLMQISECSGCKQRSKV